MPQLKNLLAWVRHYTHNCVRNAEPPYSEVGTYYGRTCRVCGKRVGW